MTDADLILVHILEFFSRKSARRGQPVPRKSSLLSENLRDSAELEVFCMFLQKEFHLPVDQDLKDFILHSTVEELVSIRIVKR